MLKNLLKHIQEERVAEQLYHSLIGIEIEEHRVDEHGRLSRQPYPQNLGSRRYHPYLQSDFSESMNEIITDPNPNIGGVLDQLDTLQTVLYRSIDQSESFWPLSMPPAMDEADTDFIKKHFGRPAYAKYRDYLTEKYGVPRKIITGVHVNFSIPEPVINRLYVHYQDQFSTLVAFKNALYFQLAQNFVLHRWLLTYLFGASPIAEKGFFTGEDQRQLTIRLGASETVFMVTLTSRKIKLTQPFIPAWIITLTVSIKQLTSIVYIPKLNFTDPYAFVVKIIIKTTGPKGVPIWNFGYWTTRRSPPTESAAMPCIS